MYSIILIYIASLFTPLSACDEQPGVTPVSRFLPAEGFCGMKSTECAMIRSRPPRPENVSQPWHTI